jgi:hypothetical protein
LSTGQTPGRKLETGESPTTTTTKYRGRSAYHYYYQILRKIRLPLLLPNTVVDPPTTTTTEYSGRSAFDYYYYSITFVIKITVTFRTQSFEKYCFKN